jgi:hypothetical protein
LLVHGESVKCDFVEIKSPILFLQYVFNLTAGKMANAIAHQRNNFKVQKPVEVLN